MKDDVNSSGLNVDVTYLAVSRLVPIPIYSVKDRTGNDRAILVGTEAEDKYVVTEGEVFGGGLSVVYNNIESVEVVTLFVSILSTGPVVATTIYGNLGSDTFLITPRLS
jgi:hypothetical protein